jgi:hypothetical protein
MMAFMSRGKVVRGEKGRRSRSARILDSTVVVIDPYCVAEII